MIHVPNIQDPSSTVLLRFTQKDAHIAIYKLFAVIFHLSF